MNVSGFLQIRLQACAKVDISSIYVEAFFKAPSGSIVTHKFGQAGLRSEFGPAGQARARSTHVVE